MVVKSEGWLSVGLPNTLGVKNFLEYLFIFKGSIPVFLLILIYQTLRVECQKFWHFKTFFKISTFKFDVKSSECAGGA